jgi:hypothetical protein
MSTVSAFKMVSGFQFKPGDTASWVWNNAASETVYSFTVQPHVLPGSQGSAKVTDVSYKIHGNPQEREVYISLQNTGSTTINYDLIMSLINI